MPGLPERSGTVPIASAISRISARVASSSAAVSVMTPSPLKTVSAKMRAGSPTSSRLIEVKSALPMSAKMRRADASSVLPSGSASLIAARGRAASPLNRSSGFLRLLQAKVAAAMSSGARTRPSLSVSMSASVRASISRPFVGQARATQSFWSSAPRFARSAPDANLT